MKILAGIQGQLSIEPHGSEQLPMVVLRERDALIKLNGGIYEGPLELILAPEVIHEARKLLDMDAEIRRREE